MSTLNTTADTQPQNLTLADMISSGTYKLVLWIEQLITRR